MDQPLAYHGVVNALEARSGWTPISRFVSAIAHVIDGHLPYRRYHAAGHALAARGTGEDAIERLVGDFIATDINPLATFFSSFRHVSGAVEAFNAYNASAQLGVRTNLDADRRHGSRSRRAGPSARRGLMSTTRICAESGRCWRLTRSSAWCA